MTRFTSLVATTLTVHTYNWNDIPVTVPDWVKTKGLLNTANTALLNGNAFKFYWDAAGKFVATDKMSDVAAW